MQLNALYPHTTAENVLENTEFEPRMKEEVEDSFASLSRGAFDHPKT